MTDDQLPAGETPPLPPPPGAFQAVQRRAAARRLQRGAVAGVLSLALFAGAFGVGSLLGGGASGPDALIIGTPEPEPVVTATPEQPPEPTPEPSPTAAPSTPAAAPSPSGSASAGPQPTASATAQPAPTAEPTPTTAPPTEPAQPQTWTLNVVDGSGTPVPGAWVHTVPESGQLRAQRLDTDGSIRLACDPSNRYLVALWDLSLRSSFRQPRGMRNLAATWVQGGSTYDQARPVSCRTHGDTLVTTALAEGGTLTGRLTYVDPDGNEQPYADGADPGGGLYCRALGLPGSQPQCANWDPVDGRYRFTGLPTGEYALQGMHSARTVEVRAGRTTALDWYECDRCRQGEKPQPTASLTPSP